MSAMENMIVDYYYLMMIEERDNVQPVIYKFPKNTQERIIKILNSDPENPLEEMSKKLGMTITPDINHPIRDPFNMVRERWGICYDYIWAYTGATWYLVEQLYNPKISLTGKYVLFPGISLVSFCSDSKLCKRVEEYLKSTELSKYYAILPAESYHITIHNGMTKIQTGPEYETIMKNIGYGMVDWNENRWKNEDDKELIAHAKELYVRETLGLHYEFTHNQGHVEMSRSLCQKRFGFANDNLRFHLTLGYKYSLEQAPSKLVEEVGQNIVKILGQELKLDLPVFCSFESMTEYEPIN